MNSEQKDKPPAKRYYRKRVHLFSLIDKIKLWPSRKGILHGIRSIEKWGDQARVTTHCNKDFLIYNSKNSRAARWLRNKQFAGVCPHCGVPDWKLEKYNATRFSRHQGSLLFNDQKERTDLEKS
jgi:pyrrolysyl-tRNA synthetase-like protein